MYWYKKALQNYFNCRTRACRKEFWMFVLFNFLILAALQIAVGIIGLLNNCNLDFVVGLYNLAILIPGITAGIRRLHDIDRSAWNLLWVFLPVFGVIILLIMFCRQGTDGINSYGSDPLGDDE